MENGQSQTKAPAEISTPELTQWPLPEGVKNVLQKLTGEQHRLLLSLGMLEADYLLERDRLMRELGTRKQRWQTTINEAALAGGLDIEQQKWILDEKTMSLVKQP